MGFSENKRKKIFDNAKGYCEVCRKKLCLHNHVKGSRGAWNAHHKTSSASGGRDIPSNGCALCVDCHKKTRTYGKH